MLIHSQLGRTDIALSTIGLGTVKFGRNQQVKYPNAFTLPTDKEILSLLECAQELGINLLDTAPAYGLSEERLGNLLQHQRPQWIISTKVGEEFIDGKSYYDFSEKSVAASIERSLKRLQTDYLDIVLVHSNGDDVSIIETTPIFSLLEKFKLAGKIRAFGMSTKTVAGGLLAVDHSDVVMITHNPTYTEEQPVLAYAQQNNKGIFIKKALASGHLDKFSSTNPVLTAFRFIFQERGISSVIVGTLNPNHLRQNVECVLLAS